MFVGRFLVIVPVLAIAGSLAAKRAVPRSAGTLPTDGLQFVLLLTGTILIVGGSDLLSGIVARPAGRAFRYAGAGHLLTNDQAALSADLGCQRDLVSTTRSAAADPRSW